MGEIKVIKISTLPLSGSSVLEIYTVKTLQKMTGFGSCFNEFGWEALKLIPTEKQEEIFKQLFSPWEANFQFNRLPIVASDYSLDFYSFNETKNDFEMKDFSIELD